MSRSTADSEAEARDVPALVLLDQWDEQQAAYVADRESRFRTMLDVVELAVGPSPTVVDLACGPGSLAARVLTRFPAARVVGLDHDPLLLQVARDSLAHHGERVTLVDADLLDARWPAAVTAALSGAAPDVVLSTTALHWLLPGQLVEVYVQVSRLLSPGGVLLNGDHLRFDARHPTLAGVAAEHDVRTQSAGFTSGAPTWAQWWESARGMPGGSDLAALREERFAGRVSSPPTTVDFHLAALAQAGFSEVAPVWQLFDDYIVFGRLPVR